MRALRIYAGGVIEAIDNIRHGPDWNRNIVNPNAEVLRDAQRGTLPAVTWVSPDLRWADYPSIHKPWGPSWVADIVNAIGRGPHWKDTAIVLMWDDWGGWYDNAAPPQIDTVGLGMRVPLLVISPYAKRGAVSHTQYEYGSILKFVEQAFDLPALGPVSLGYTDARARTLADSFDFTQKPRAFKPIPAPYPAAYFLSHAPSHEPPDSQ